jgi:hypothetical protein
MRPRRKDSSSLNCLNSSVSSFIGATITFQSALSISTRAFWAYGLCWTPLRSKQTTQRLRISLRSRARNLRRAGLSWSRFSATAASGCV